MEGVGRCGQVLVQVSVQGRLHRIEMQRENKTCTTVCCQPLFRTRQVQERTGSTTQPGRREERRAAVCVQLSVCQRLPRKELPGADYTGWKVPK